MTKYPLFPRNTLTPVPRNNVARYSLGHRHQRVERQQICHQVIILNKLTLLIAHVLGDHTLATEAHPLDEFVENLAFVVAA